MKKLLFLSIVSLFFCTSGLAQNWSPVNLSDKYNFQNDTADYITNTIWVDSVEVQDLDSVFYLNRIVKPCDTCQSQPWSNLYLANQEQFLQRTIRKENEDEYIFLGQTPFTIFAKADLNDTWLLDSLNEIEATISNIQEIQLFDNQDSIKTISLSIGDSILLSKNHGIIYFPKIYEGSSFNLVGIEGRDLGELVPKFVDFYDFEVGDVFQYSGDYGYFPAFSSKFFKYTILNKEVIEDTIKYICTTSSCSYPTFTPELINCSYNHTTTLIYINYENHFLNGYPHQLQYHDLECSEPAYSIVMLSRDEDGKITKRLSEPNSENPWDLLGIFNFVNDTSEILIPEAYSDFSVIAEVNLGIIKHYADPFEGCMSEDLIGYVKNGDTTGIVYPDSSYIVSTKEIFHEDFSIYPNPTNGQIMLDFNGRSHGEINLQIMDAFGKKVHQQFIEKEKSSAKIDLQHLPKGVYFIFGKDDGQYFSEKIIRH